MTEDAQAILRWVKEAAWNVSIAKAHWCERK